MFYEMEIRTFDHNGFKVSEKEWEFEGDIYRWFNLNGFKPLGKSGKRFVRTRNHYGNMVKDFAFIR